MKDFFLSSLGNAINRYLALDPASRDRLNPLQGQAIAIELHPLRLSFQLLITAQGILVKTDPSLPCAATLRGTPLQLLGVMLEKNNRRVFFANDLVIEGNALLSQQIIALFDELDIDWEEQLSHFTGDAPAYHLGHFMRRMKQWLKQADNSLSQNINEFVHEEADWFPTNEALQDFFNQVDTLQLDVERAEARLRQCRDNLANQEVAS